MTLHGCVIEDRCLIGMGSVILERREDRSRFDYRRRNADSREHGGRAALVVDGVPGKFKRKLEADEEETIMRYARNYLGYTEEYLREQ